MYIILFITTYIHPLYNKSDPYHKPPHITEVQGDVLGHRGVDESGLPTISPDTRGGQTRPVSRGRVPDWTLVGEDLPLRVGGGGGVGLGSGNRTGTVSLPGQRNAPLDPGRNCHGFVDCLEKSDERWLLHRATKSQHTFT